MRRSGSFFLAFDLVPPHVGEDSVFRGESVQFETLAEVHRPIAIQPLHLGFHTPLRIVGRTLHAAAEVHVELDLQLADMIFQEIKFFVDAQGHVYSSVSPPPTKRWPTSLTMRVSSLRWRFRFCSAASSSGFIASSTNLVCLALNSVTMCRMNLWCTRVRASSICRFKPQGACSSTNPGRAYIFVVSRLPISS